MPRRKASDRTGPVNTRSRGGCSECRASRVRCDTKKPACTRCQERGLICSTKLVLKWESEFVSQGRAFGRAGVWSKSKAAGKETPPSSPLKFDALSRDDQEWSPISRVEPWGFINASVEGIESPHLVKVAEKDHALAVSFPLAYRPNQLQLTGPAAPLPLFPHLSETNQGHLFDYYVHQVCPRMTTSANLPSPFASVIIPYCSAASPTVLKAVQALGACTWSRVDPVYSAVGLRLKSEALSGLRNRLTVAGAWDPEILVVMMLLCLYELVDHCDQRWTVHLKGAKALISARREQAALSASEQNEVISFVEQFFAFQDVMGRTACGEKSLFGADYWPRDAHTVDPWMGCSPELVHILSEITDLSRERKHLTSDSDRAALSLKAAKISQQLQELVQDVQDGDESFQAVAELKRLAAILYLHCALSNSSPTTGLVATYVRRILRQVADILRAGSFIGLAWPVFVAAVELDPLNDELWKDADGQPVYGRPLVLRAVAAMSEYNVLSVARTRAVIIRVWQARDAVLKPLSCDDTPELNDWDRYVAPFSTAMSLA